MFIKYDTVDISKHLIDRKGFFRVFIVHLFCSMETLCSEKRSFANASRVKVSFVSLILNKKLHLDIFVKSVGWKLDNASMSRVLRDARVKHLDGHYLWVV